MKNIVVHGFGFGLVLLCTACLYEEKEAPFSQRYPAFAEAVSTSWSSDFSINPETGRLENVAGQRLGDFLERVGKKPAGYIKLSPYSLRAFKQATNLFRNRFSHRDKIVLEATASSLTADPQTELRVTIQQSGIKRHSCQATGEKLPFGCSVFINRAVSLVDPAELSRGQSLSYPVAQYDAFVFRNFLDGRDVPLRSSD